MANFRIILNIDIDAENPLDAAKKIENWSKDPDTHFQYYVYDEKTKEISIVDLDMPDDIAVFPNSQLRIVKAFDNLW